MSPKPPDDDLDEGLFEWADDICRNNHGGNPESEEANLETDKARGCSRIKAFLESLGFQGATVWEVRVTLGMLHQTASARLSEMKRDKITVLKPSGQPEARGRARYERRPTNTGCLAAVHILAKFKPGVKVTLDL